jgi:hypothetical protein
MSRPIVPSMTDLTAFLAILPKRATGQSIELALPRRMHGPGEVHAVFVDPPWRG